MVGWTPIFQKPTVETLQGLAFSVVSSTAGLLLPQASADELMLALMGKCYWLNTLNPCEKTWMFPETAVPLNHPFIDGIFMIFHYKSSSYLGVPPFMEPPIWRFQSTETVLNPEELGATILTNEPTSGASFAEVCICWVPGVISPLWTDGEPECVRQL